jgi:hypothetical protein
MGSTTTPIVTGVAHMGSTGAAAATPEDLNALDELFASLSEVPGKRTRP